MSTKTPNGCVLIFRGDEWYKQLSPAELQKAFSEVKAWYDRLVAQGKATGGQVLAREGATIMGRTRQLVVDGPYAESKEAIGGTLLLEVDTLEEAIAIARTNPHLAYNTTIDIRPVAEECPLIALVRQHEPELEVAQT